MTGSCRASEDVAHSLGVCVFPVEQVHRHLEQHEVRYLQFAFRWMNNLLMRELPLRCTIRLWDTYQVSPRPSQELDQAAPGAGHPVRTSCSASALHVVLSAEQPLD